MPGALGSRYGTLVNCTIARSKVANRSGEGLVRDIILGILGAVLGDAICTWLGLVGVTGVNLPSTILAAIGAILILVFYHAILGKRATV
jgi:uncharacterized membrane protein YeaQ/YmgE (transglycosylase-associated protein family)